MSKNERTPRNTKWSQGMPRNTEECQEMLRNNKKLKNDKE